MSDDNNLPLSNPFVGRVGLNFEGAEPVNVWVDSLPGMSVELADNLRGEDAQALWERMQPVVYQRFASRLESILSKRSAFRHIIVRSTNNMPRLMPGVINSLHEGLLVEVVADGEHVSLKLGPLVCYCSPNNQAVTVVVLEVDANGNETEVYAEPATLSRRRMEFMAKGFVLPLTSRATMLEVCFREDLSTALMLMEGNPTSDPDSLSIKPLSGDPADCAFHLNAVLTCDFASIIERYADKLDWAYAYQCAHYLLDDKLSSNLMNVYTNTNRDDTLQRRDDYKAEIDTLIGQACAIIVRDMEAGASPFLFVDESTQPGVHMGGYV